MTNTVQVHYDDPTGQSTELTLETDVSMAEAKEQAIGAIPSDATVHRIECLDEQSGSDRSHSSLDVEFWTELQLKANRGLSLTLYEQIGNQQPTPVDEAWFTEGELEGLFEEAQQSGKMVFTLKQ